jgi:predicted nucleotidyltransferase
MDGKMKRRLARKGLVDVTVFVPAEKTEAVKRYAARIGRLRHPARRDEIIERLRESRHHLDRFGVSSLALFGSVVRDEARPQSDVDLLVEFEPGRPDGLFQFVELKNVLEGILGRPVDLITAANIKPRLKARILGEAVRVF